jgi:hypothetical protein
MVGKCRVERPFGHLQVHLDGAAFGDHRQELTDGRERGLVTQQDVPGRVGVDRVAAAGSRHGGR